MTRAQIKLQPNFRVVFTDEHYGAPDKWTVDPWKSLVAADKRIQARTGEYLSVKPDDVFVTVNRSRGIVYQGDSIEEARRAGLKKVGFFHDFVIVRLSGEIIKSIAPPPIVTVE